MKKIPREKFMRLLLAQDGDSYVFGAEARPTDPDPEAFDCSELIEWAMERLGVPDFPDGSFNQYPATDHITVDKGIKTRGALLFRDPSVTGIGHVAVSLGDGRTIEARGSAYGVGVFDASPSARLWTGAGLFREIDYAKKELRVPKVERWVVFRRKGGRQGHIAGKKDLTSLNDFQTRKLLDLIEQASESGAALVVHVKEAKDLEDAPTFALRRKDAA